MNRNPKTWFRFQISGLTGYGNQSWYVVAFNPFYAAGLSKPLENKNIIPKISRLNLTLNGPIPDKVKKLS